MAYKMKRKMFVALLADEKKIIPNKEQYVVDYINLTFGLRVEVTELVIY